MGASPANPAAALARGYGGVLAVLALAWGYGMAGAWRDLALLGMAPVLLASVRLLRPGLARLVSVLGLAGFALVMTLLVVSSPLTHDIGQELVRFMLLALGVITLWQYTGDDGTDSPLHALGRLVFTDCPRQRVRIQRYMVAAANFVVCTIVLAYAISLGRVDRGWGTALGAYMMGNVLVFYLLLRSGFSLRFADPALTLPQILVATTCVVWAYTLLNETRGAALILLALVLFFGVFNLSARQTRLAAMLALGLQGAAMLAMSTLAPDRYPPRQELMHFLFACSSLPTISLLAGQLSELRARLQARKEELAQALERIQLLATRDELTGLFNRRHMLEALDMQKKLCDRGERLFCIAIVDIDHFKQVNDTHGHGVGDEVLRHFAQTLQGVLRETDVLSRWGGEEFLVMFTGSRLDSAEVGLTRAREALRHLEMSETVPGLRVTFSAGVSEQRRDEALAQTIERADQALYQAKRSGRDRTMVG